MLFRPSKALVIAGIVLGAASCQRAHGDGTPEPAAVTGSESAPAAIDASRQDDVDCHPVRATRPPPPGASATALGADHRARVTTVRVSAHVGAVTLRKLDAGWVASGQDGCVVPARRVERALDDLAKLETTATEERPADGRAFELQIVALMGEEVALGLALADRGLAGDLVQLHDGSRVRMRGLDRSAWSPHPRDWCKDP